jgi:hypothetical protein
MGSELQIWHSGSIQIQSTNLPLPSSRGASTISKSKSLEIKLCTRAKILKSPHNQEVIQMGKSKFILIAIVFAALFDHTAMAESLRCGTNLVEVGDVKAEVVEKCGPPIATDSYCRNEYLQGKWGYEAVCRNVDLWTYNFGIGTFLMNVEFEEGKISNISHGDRIK